MKCDFCNCKIKEENTEHVIDCINGNQFVLHICDDCFDQKFRFFEIEEEI